MKKRLLITSIVMMLVVAVALSTATYAWFTSNDSVTANTVSLTAATSTESAIGIAWAASAETPGTADYNADYGTFIAPYEMATLLQPAAPAALNNIDGAAAPSFYTANINSQGAFKSVGASTPVYRMATGSDSGASGYSNEVHIANLAFAGSKTVYMTATIDGDIYVEITSAEAANPTIYDYYDGDKTILQTQPAANAEVSTGFKKMKANAVALIRIAVFEVNNGTYTYKGLLSQTAAVDGDDVDNDPDPNTAVGAITNGGTATDLITYASTTELNLGTFEAQQDKGYAIYIWMDGQLFTEAFSTKSARIGLTFTTSGAATEINA